MDREPSTDSEATYRLPRSVTPSRYDLTLEPSLDTATFEGHEAIAVTVHEPVTEIVLNAKELEVLDGSLEAADGSTIDLEKVVLDAGSERVTLGLADTATPGEWSLRLRFRGTLNDRMVGFYRSRYDDDGASQDLAYEGTRRMLVNAVYWALGLEAKIPERSNVDLVGEYKPTPFGFNGFIKGRKPEFYGLR